MAQVGELIRQVFPFGTPSLDDVLRRTRAQDSEPSWREAPASPIDLFAVCGLLLMRSGAYHHVRPAGERPARRRTLEVSAADRESWRETGRLWRTSPRTPPLVNAAWSALIGCEQAPLYEELSREAPPPGWWRSALTLFVVADEAALNVGFLDESAWMNVLADALVLENQSKDRPSITLSLADPDVVCVLPKSRTPTLGCTLRSLSHNLALLPPRGLARAQWTKWDTLSGDGRGASERPLNLLLIPYPYALPAQRVVDRGAGVGEGGDWGWFALAPAGGPEGDRHRGELVAHVGAMLEAARHDVGEVHGLVFPEMSLSRAAYREIVALCCSAHDVEFIVAGSFQDDQGEASNVAILTGLLRNSGETRTTESYQQKHHRWRLDASQIGGYSLGTRLSPTRLWWEDLEITSRSLAVATLRRSTTVAALICEDLARVDPAQEVLRALGPNLVIALLMDGPQLKDRWSARYATVLADDPGSSVLSFTSLGLIERTNQTGRYEPSRAIALWRDRQGERVLKLPSGAGGLVITVSTEVRTEATLDGRDDGGNTLGLLLSGVLPIRTDTAPPSGWAA